MIPFPALPELENQVLSAATLNDYHRALRWLLAESHAAQPLQESPFVTTTEVAYTKVWAWHWRHQDDTLIFRYTARTTDINARWDVSLRVVKAGVETEVYTYGTTGNAFTGYAIQLGISGLALTVGGVYEWRLYLKCSTGTEHAECHVWSLCERGTAAARVSGNVTNGAVAQASQFNAFRTDLNNMRTRQVSAINPLLCHDNEQAITGTSYVNCQRAVYRYRPGTLYARLRARLPYGDGWVWRVRLEKWGGATTTLYESGHIVGTGAEQWSPAAEIDMSAQGLALGDYARIHLDARRLAASVAPLHVVRQWLVRASAGTPHADWRTLDDWVHGATNVGAAALGAIVANIEVLRAGNERLWGETYAASYWPGLTRHSHTGVHRKRWLKVLPSTTQPVLYWGPNLELSASLPAEGWPGVDLGAAGIPLGSYYALDGAYSAMEVDG